MHVAAIFCFLGGEEGVEEEEFLCCDLVLTRCDIILLLARPLHSCFRAGERES